MRPTASLESSAEANAAFRQIESVFAICGRRNKGHLNSRDKLFSLFAAYIQKISPVMLVVYHKFTWKTKQRPNIIRVISEQYPEVSLDRRLLNVLLMTI